MEHNFDEAFGYVYGLLGDAQVMTSGISSEGSEHSDILFYKYLYKVNDGKSNDIAQDLFNAFRDGRQAIVDKDYQRRDENIKTIRKLMSLVMLTKSIDYLEGSLDTSEALSDRIHDLSEGMGFILSLMFTNDGNNNSYLSLEDLKSSSLYNDFY